MATQRTTRNIPSPLYAAAGAGEFAYEQLRKLPERVAELRERVNELPTAMTEVVSETSFRADLRRLRRSARRNAVLMLSGAQVASQVAQERAAAVYTDLVARGKRVVRTVGPTEAAVVIRPGQAKLTTEIMGAADQPAVRATRAAGRTSRSAASSTRSAASSTRSAASSTRSTTAKATRSATKSTRSTARNTRGAAKSTAKRSQSARSS